MPSSNTAALQGWVKSTDPKTGRAFFANHVTRKTQWDPPDGWVEVEENKPAALNSMHSVTDDDDDDDDSLPSNWEVMHDPTSGRPFYVDHESKITTWTKPKKPKEMNQQHSGSFSLRPAIPSPPSSGNYHTTNSGSFGKAAVAHRLLSQQQQQSSSAASSYYQNTSNSYSTSHIASDATCDWSDALQPLDFVVHSVPDKLRSVCPDCQTKVFSLTNRRHHCRLCGDVYCGDCCSARVILPPMTVLSVEDSGSTAESSDSKSSRASTTETPVRVCRACHIDVQQDNYFSIRRYFTPLLLSEPSSHKSSDTSTSAPLVASSKQVNAALSALNSDLQQMIAGLSDTIAVVSKADFVQHVAKHLESSETRDRAMQCLATLLTLEAITGGGGSQQSSSSSGSSWKVVVYQRTVAAPITLFEHVVATLERSSTDRKTLYVQEQAAKILYYLTEPKTIQMVLQQVASLTNADNKEGDVDDGSSNANFKHPVELLDLHRAIRCTLDQASGSKYINLQRWAAACLLNLILEDQRRACMAINDAASMIASSEQPADDLSYTSCLEELISTGGIMILTTLISADDPDTRAHAVGALGATLSSTRAVDASLLALSEMTGGAYGTTSGKDGMIVRAIVAGGGCASAVAQLLLSADNSVAGMGCNLLASLVMPLLSDPQASQTLSSNYDYRNDQSAVGACREASIEIVTGCCLPALISLVRENGKNSRPLELRKIGMETLAAIVMSIGNMGSAWAQGRYEEGLERANAPGKLKDAILMLNEEGVIDSSLEVLQSSTGQSFGSDRETPTSRISECAGIILGSLTSCSAEAIIELQTRNILATMLVASNDSGMPVQSTLRGDAAPRCLGIVETVSAVFMFAWQHPSGASSELLDRLIELLDAGVVPLLSKVLNSKIDWDLKDKSVGAMKARTASCRLLSCLFGVALTDPTGIGMRRLMESVDADSRSYRGGEKSPSNIIESVLNVLQRALHYSRSSLLGALNQGPHYHAAVMDLADAALLATGSMCGSSVAPGGSEGSMVTGESFLAARTSDQYAAQRMSVCKVACDVVVRGGKGGPALLPTMLVGGFGEATVLSSLRLSLAIAQNGSKDEHAKLALSGLLVPISDSLKAALNSGDLYKFSASLAMVRFCGPHVAAGAAGGVQSVRHAIRVATKVLTLPINPDASLEQLEVQDALKSECIAALESLSHNTSLWSSISSEALPAIAQYLHTTALMKSGSAQRRNTRCAALKAVLQIVQVPSHAVAAVEAGIVDPLCRLLRTGDDSNDEVQMLALEILHVISKNPHARAKANFLAVGLAKSVCAALAKSSTFTPDKPSDNRADVTFLGLELLHSIVSDIGSGLDTSMVLSSKGAADILDAAASEPQFVRALCSTLLLQTNMELPRHQTDNSGGPLCKISSKYGPPLVEVSEKCAGYDTTHAAAAGLFYELTLFACAVETAASECFWKTLLFQDAHGLNDDDDLKRLAATLCVHILALLTVDYQPFLPLHTSKLDDFAAITRPLVQYRMLSALKDTMAELNDKGSASGEGVADPYISSLLVAFKVPHICLALWKDPLMVDLGFELIKDMIEHEQDEILLLFVEGETVIRSLFGFLNLDPTFASSEKIVEIRRFLASVLARLAESGLLVEAVTKYNMKDVAIEALATACLGEDGPLTGEDDDDMASARLSATLMRSLVDLCTTAESKDLKKHLQLTTREAESVARILGKKVCHMVVSRFLERAKLEEYEMGDDDDLMEAPDVAMLCAVAQHDEALKVLRTLGGLHALSLIAAEGNLPAMTALEKACSADISVLLEGETHIAMMSILADESDVVHAPALESIAFGLLARLCRGSSRGRKSVVEADNCRDCVLRAMNVLSGGTNLPSVDTENVDFDPAVEDKKDDESSLSSPPSYSALDNPKTNAGFVNDMPMADGRVDHIVAACSFLSALVQTKIGQASILTNEECFESLRSMVKSDVIRLSFAVVSTLVSFAPYARMGGVVTPGALAEALVSVLTSDKKSVSSADLNSHKMNSAAVTGINILFESLPAEYQKEVAAMAAQHFQRVVKIVVVTRATSNEADKAYSAELSHSLSLTLLLVRGKDFSDAIVTQDLLTSMIHLIQWRHDPKTSLGTTNQRYWDASIANCLILLSATIWRPDEALEAANISLKTMSGTSLMLSRPGKAPRKAIDLEAVLDRLQQGPDSSTSVVAQRISERLFQL